MSLVATPKIDRRRARILMITSFIGLEILGSRHKVKRPRKLPRLSKMSITES